MAKAEHALELTGIVFSHNGANEFLFRDLNLQIPEGCLVAILGPSGCGKTTLLNLMLGYLEPEGGAILLNGVPIMGPSTACLPISQEDGTWPWLTALQNITLHSLLIGGRKAADVGRPQGMSILAQVGLSEQVADQYPRSLSVGMKKRLEIGRALYAKPEIILADEPFSGVDEHIRRGLYRVLERIWREYDRTVVVATHDVNEALLLAGRLIVLRRSCHLTEISLECDNPFQSDEHARRRRPGQYFELYDQVLVAMEPAT